MRRSGPSMSREEKIHERKRSSSFHSDPAGGAYPSAGSPCSRRGFPEEGGCAVEGSAGPPAAGGPIERREEVDLRLADDRGRLSVKGGFAAWQSGRLPSIHGIRPRDRGSGHRSAAERIHREE